MHWFRMQLREQQSELLVHHDRMPFGMHLGGPTSGAFPGESLVASFGVASDTGPASERVEDLPPVWARVPPLVAVLPPDAAPPVPVEPPDSTGPSTDPSPAAARLLAAVCWSLSLHAVNTTRANAAEAKAVLRSMP